jgi:hypothetical protein
MAFLMAPRPIWLDDVLQIGLKEGPFVSLDSVVDFKHGGRVRLIDIPLLLEGSDIRDAVLAKSEDGHKLIGCPELG